MTLWIVAAAWAADGACPAGTSSLSYCASNGTYTQLCGGSGTLRVVEGKVGRPPDVVYPEDGAAAAFSVHQEGGDDDGSRVLWVTHGDRTWYFSESWSPMPSGLPFVRITQSRGGAWALDRRCVQTSLIELPPGVRSAAGPTVPKAPAVAPSCGAGQTSVLTCGVDQKVLSVCESAAGLQYRFGPPGAPELVYPEAPSATAFRREADTSGNGHNVSGALSFDRDGFTYEIWSSMPDSGNGDPPAAGVRVRRAEKVVANLECTHGIQSTLPWKLQE